MFSFLKSLFQTQKETAPKASGKSYPNKIGLIAGNSSFPIKFIEGANKQDFGVVAVCHSGETQPEVEGLASVCEWIKVGQLGKLITVFKENGITQAAMAGGINRVKLFGGVKLDMRGAALLARLRSAKDDVIMRGIAEELQSEGIEIIDSTRFMQDCIIPEGWFVGKELCPEVKQDIQIGVDAIASMSSQDIGQTVVVKEGVVVAVEAVEGTDAAIRRGGELGGAGAVVVKFAKTTQDMRFDVPTIGPRTIETMASVKASVLAVESGRCLLLDEEETLALAQKHNITLVGCEPLVKDSKLDKSA